MSGQVPLYRHTGMSRLCQAVAVTGGTLATMWSVGALLTRFWLLPNGLILTTGGVRTLNLGLAHTPRESWNRNPRIATP